MFLILVLLNEEVWRARVSAIKTVSSPRAMNLPG
jgi:hypothetical protein